VSRARWPRAPSTWRAASSWGKPRQPLRATSFAIFERITRETLSCTLAAFDALTARQRSQLFAPLSLDADQPLDGSVLTAALAEEIQQRVGVQVFNDPLGPEQERAGLIRDHVPQPGPKM
jgi:hypothetical protein